MQFGNLSGLVNGTEQVVFDYEVSGSAVSSIDTGSILNGDEDGWYTVILRVVGATSQTNAYLRFNSDSGANYGYNGINVDDTVLYSTIATGNNGIFMNINSVAVGNVSFSVAKVHAKSGSVRFINTVSADNITSTTVKSINPFGQVWNNTASNITSIQAVSYSGASTLGVGTRLIILKSNNFTNGTPTGVITTPYVKGSWVRVASSLLGSSASSVTFSSLDGDRDVIYCLSALVKGSGAGGSFVYVSPNADSGNKGFQRVQAYGTTKDGFKGTSYNGINIGLTASSSSYSNGQLIMFAKQGYLRTSISSFGSHIVGALPDTLAIYGYSWSVTNTNITSLVITASSVNFDTGSSFELYALRPNG